MIKYFLLSLISGIQVHAGFLLTLSFTILIAYYTGRSSKISEKQMEETYPAISKIEKYTDNKVKIFIVNRKPNPIEIKNVYIKKCSANFFQKNRDSNLNVNQLKK